MEGRVWLGLLMAFSLSTVVVPQSKPNGAQKAVDAGALTASEHRAGPHGLEGWTLEGPIPDAPHEKYPFALVIARNGRPIRRLDGDPFVWKWMWVEDGKQVAYESGPLHFGLTCILADVETGRKLSSYDCYQELPDDAPDWVDALERAP